MSDAGLSLPALRVAGVSKTYGVSRALADVSFDIWRGRVHALLGENGAGKSTLVKIITGIIEADSGQIFVGSNAVHFRTPIEARIASIAAVYQDPKLFAHLDVAENIFMGAYPTTLAGTVDRKTMYERAERALYQLGLDLDPRSLIAGLSVAELQFVEIARALVAELQLRQIATDATATYDVKATNIDQRLVTLRWKPPKGCLREMARN